MQYRKRPIVIEAEQFDPAARPWPDYVHPWPDDIPHAADSIAYIETLEGFMDVRPGDFIITGVKGEHYPCKPDIFAMTYEPAEAQHDQARIDGALKAVRLEMRCPCGRGGVFSGEQLAAVLRAELRPKGIGVELVDNPLLKLILPTKENSNGKEKSEIPPDAKGPARGAGLQN